jgi:hypothetical protein
MHGYKDQIDPECMLSNEEWNRMVLERVMDGCGKTAPESMNTMFTSAWMRYCPFCGEELTEDEQAELIVKQR